MTRIFARAATVAALVTAVAIPAVSSAGAASDVAPSGRQAVERVVAKSADQPSTWASKNGGYVQINWTPPFTVGKYDWVGLYKRDPASIGINSYETYQWAYGRGTSYLTSTPAVSGDYWTAYISWDYASGQYRIIESHKTHID